MSFPEGKRQKQLKSTPWAKSCLALLIQVMMAASCAANALPQGGQAPALQKLTPKTAPTETQPTTPSAQSATPRPKETQAAGKPAAMPPSAPSVDKFTQLTNLEQIMFGKSQPNIPLEYRLDRLESEVYHQTNPDWDAQRRIDRLLKTLVGGGKSAGDSATSAPPSPNPAPFGPMPPAAPYQQDNAYLPALPTVPNMPLDQAAAQAAFLPQPIDAGTAEFTKPLTRQQLEQYAMELINDKRLTMGLKPLVWDETAYKLAKNHTLDLCKRNTVEHLNQIGENPDVRYTRAGGSDCLTESVVGIKLQGRPVPNRELVYNVMKDMTSHQDDRDALFGSHATHFGFAFDISGSSEKLIACAETITKQASVQPVPPEVKVGERIPIKGQVTAPFKFQKITVAWEGLPPGGSQEEQEEATPYFPPLDYEAYARKSEHDYRKAKQLLQIAGIGLCLAGGMFIPPVALAAPLIAAAPVQGKPRAVSEIPIKGGVKSDGYSFDYEAPVSKESKEGIYYITVWAESEVDQASFAVSRRAIIARQNIEPQIQTAIREAQSKQPEVKDQWEKKQAEKLASKNKAKRKREKNAN